MRSWKWGGLCLSLLLVACGGSERRGGGGGTGNATSNKARFNLDCDLNGETGKLVINVEAVGASGIVYGSGTNPDITGVISTGEVIYYTAGDLTSSVAYYTFTGENNFADFTESTTFERFRVEWQLTNDGLIMIINPFGPGPTQHNCVLTSSMYL